MITHSDSFAAPRAAEQEEASWRFVLALVVSILVAYGVILWFEVGRSAP